MEYAHEVTFHVQAGSRIGMGHLSRSRALINVLQGMGFNCNLHLNADAQGISKAISWGLVPMDTWPDIPSALVIDAVNLDSLEIKLMQGYSPRILISPVFNHAEMVSHALLRAIPPALLNDLSSSTVVHVNSDYSFTTAHGLTPRNLDLSKLEIGLCLSGGANSMEPNTVLSLLDGLPQVSGVKVIDPHHLSPIGTPLKHVMHTEQPWDFFDDINLFIGGDGVMIAEAIAQALPTISLSMPISKTKNIGLAESGALHVILRDAYMLSKLAALLSDRKELVAMHSAALELNGAARANHLALDIRTILEENSA